MANPQRRAVWPLLVLSSESMNSEWVKTEIRKARKAEIKEKGRKLFPIRLVDFETIEGLGAASTPIAVKDLGDRDCAKFFIPDFSNWKDHDAFESAFARLLRDLKAEESTGAKPGLNPLPASELGLVLARHRLDALTIARMPALIASGRSGQAATTAARSGSV